MNKVRILIIDDEQAIRLTISEILTIKGYETEMAQNGAEALLMLSQQPFNLVLIDLGLPDINGLELLEKVKSGHPDTEAIVLTGDTTVTSAVEATNLGAFSYLIKPYEIEQLLLQIRRAIEKQQSAAALQASQLMMFQSEKMASIGQLAAGVAHEINNPVGFIISNLSTLAKYSERLTSFIETQTELLKSTLEQNRLDELDGLRKQIKLEYIIRDIPQLISESLDGAERVKIIVQNLKTFSRKDEEAWKQADINDCLESTLKVVWNELKYKAEIVRVYGELPLLKCNPGQLNQVFMNLLVNAAHAIGNGGTITIRTWHGQNGIHLSISDNGHGIPDQIRSRIFEPFFTTKEVGQGTGLGLSISYDIVRKHGGTIEVDSSPDTGTTFTVHLPFENSNVAEEID
jgi:signal transduction histidine kinase